jgi:hypothetical protein
MDPAERARLDAAIERARLAADTSVNPADWALYHSLVAIAAAADKAALLAALTEVGPVHDLPAWSQISAE